MNILNIDIEAEKEREFERMLIIALGRASLDLLRINAENNVLKKVVSMKCEAESRNN